MINSRRAIAAAVFLIAIFFLISQTHITDAFSGARRGPRARVLKKAGGSLNAKHQYIPGQIRPAAQRPMIDMTHMSTTDKLDYAYPYDINMRFPAYVWQTWKYGPDDKNFHFKDQTASWTYEHPGFIHQVILDDVAVNLLRLLYATIPEVLEAYHSLPLPVLKADFFRYLILYARGGIYSDIDTYAIQSALNWIPDNISKTTVGLVIGIEADPDRPDWADWYSRRIQFCQWTIQAKPGHPVLREIITRITEETLELKRTGQLAGFKGEKVVDLTGPAIWTDTIIDYFNDPKYFITEEGDVPIDYKEFTGMDSPKRVGDVVVLPITSFSPGVGQMGSKEPDDPMAFVKHDFEGSWKPDSERHIGENPDELSESRLAELEEAEEAKKAAEAAKAKQP